MAVADLPILSPSANRLDEGAQVFRDELSLGFRRSAVVVLVLIMVSALAILAVTAWSGDGPISSKLRYMFTTIVVFAVAAWSLWMGYWWGTRPAAIFFSTAVIASLLGSAWIMGNGVLSGGVNCLVAAVAICGFLVGPVAVLWATAASAGGLGLLLWAEQTGRISGITATNMPNLTTQAIIKITVCVLVGWLIHRYGNLFWKLIGSMEHQHERLAHALRAQEQAATELRERESLLRTLLDNSVAGILILGAHTGERKFANQQFLQRHGCQTVDQLQVNQLLADAEHGPTQWLALLRKTLKEGPQLAPWRTEHVDGTPIWWDFRFDKLTYQGETCVACFGHDVTARVAAERALQENSNRLEQMVQQRTAELQGEQQRTQAIIESLPITLCLSDPSGRILRVNRRFEVAAGVSRGQLIGRRLTDLTADGGLSAAAELVNPLASWRAGDASAPIEYRMLRSGAVRADFLLTSVAMHNAEGEPEAMINLGTDITPQKRLEAELRLAKDEAEQLARVKSEFLANMSHEIRTPLNAILGQAQLGAGDPTKAPTEHRRFDAILRSGNFLLRLINDILDSSKLESGKVEIVPTPTALQTLIHDSVAMVKGPARDKNLPIKVVIDPATPSWVNLDRLRVSQVLVNLLSNAVKFTEKGQVTLVVNTGAAADGPRLNFEIVDTGVGIASEAMGRLFNAFEQADGSTTRRFGGTGLGLSISRRLTELMHGALSARSELGRGSTFVLSLPLIPAQPPSIAPMAPLSALGPHLLQGWRILVTDDVEANREILREMLESAGAEVVATEDGESAVLHFAADQAQRGFDAVLMDIQMPGMDGYEATRRLHALDPAIPVLALTAHALESERQRTLAAGMVAHITKPIDMQALYAALLSSRLAVKASLARPFAAQPDLTAPIASDKTNPAPMSPDPAVPPQTLYWPRLADFDEVGALRRCSGKQVLLARLLRLFMTEYAQHGERLTQARDADAAQLAAMLHRLRGGAANLGLMGLSRAVSQAEAMQASADASAFDGAFNQVLDTLASTLQALRDWDARLSALSA